MLPQHPAVGIDLGTTYSVVAYIDNTGRPVSIPNELGDILTPSAIFVDDDDVIIGKEH
ncbi:MAG: Hsp70 family protein [Pirellulaceae bacterium]